MDRSQLPPSTATRADVLRTAERFERAALLLKAHARRCTVPEATAHAMALRQARGMVRAEVDTGQPEGIE